VDPTRFVEELIGTNLTNRTYLTVHSVGDFCSNIYPVISRPPSRERARLTDDVSRYCCVGLGAFAKKNCRKQQTNEFYHEIIVTFQPFAAQSVNRGSDPLLSNSLKPAQLHASHRGREALMS